MRTVVAIVRGGPSSEYDVSLKTGAAVLGALDKDKYEPRDIFISRAGAWHLHGVEVAPERALHGTDIVFNAMHGEFGEDGQVQRVLEQLGVPYTGSGAFASATAYNKHLTKEQAKKLGIKTPYGVMVKNIGGIDMLTHSLFRTFPHPAIIKPVTGGSSLGTSLAHNFAELQQGLETAFSFSPEVLVEEFIKGREATVGVIDNFRNEEVYALLPTEIVLPQGAPFNDYETKRADATELRTPGNFSSEVKQELQRVAKAVHKGLGLSHHSRSDFIISKRGIYFLEVETSVDLGKGSEFVHALHAVGSKLSEFIDHVIELARRKK